MAVFTASLSYLVFILNPSCHSFQGWQEDKLGFVYIRQAILPPNPTYQIISTMGIFQHNEDHANAHNEFHNATTPEHKAKLSHQLIAGAATYEMTKAYNEHCAKNGKPNNHAKAMEIIAGLSGVVITRFAETKGAEMFDKHKAKQDLDKYAKDHFDTVDFGSK
ncbi:hypothetical protein AX14_004413 [Amanita brunnescens Koide BX004]|nr:hypothetical protein AX14_004413 [Amanita brunnescens Koide BX004]